MVPICGLIFKKSYIGRGFFTISQQKRLWIELAFTFLLVGILFYTGTILIIKLTAKDSSPNKKLNVTTKFSEELNQILSEEISELKPILSKNERSNVSNYIFWIINFVVLSFFLLFGMYYWFFGDGKHELQKNPFILVRNKRFNF